MPKHATTGTFSKKEQAFFTQLEGWRDLFAQDTYDYKLNHESIRKKKDYFILKKHIPESYFTETIDDNYSVRSIHILNLLEEFEQKATKNDVISKWLDVLGVEAE